MITLDILRDIVCIECAVSMHQMMRVRNAKAVDARKIFVLLALDVMHYRRCEVIEYVGSYDNSVITHYATNGRKLLASDARFSESFESLKACIVGDTDWGSVPHAVAILKMELLKRQLEAKMSEVDEVVKELNKTV